MAQILRFPTKNEPQSPAETYGRLIAAFSQGRRDQKDVFWLKENAELLNILECTGALRGAPLLLNESALAPLRAFYAGATRHLCFFRQYYRFILSICMDLEDLGLVGDGAGQGRPHSGGQAGMSQMGQRMSEALAQWVLQQDLAAHELSDLQRAEACRLLARRGVTLEVPGLNERLHRFMDATAQFALPNRKAAYELTHIVFYLSEYGRGDPGLSPAAAQSLNHVGTLAFLDRDADLLSEVCIALRYSGQSPSALWEAWLLNHHRGFVVLADETHSAPLLAQDDYHMFLVSNWHQALRAGPAFQHAAPEGALRFQAPVQQGILHSLSQAVFSVADTAADWQSLRSLVAAGLSEADNAHLSEAERSCMDFEVFFEGFARLGTIGAEPAQAARR
jgi:Domain of unknown function (DUF6902)